MRRFFLAAVVALSALCTTALRAQIPYHVFDEHTQVSSLGFTFPGTKTFPAARLLLEMVLRERGMFDGLRDRLQFLPVIGPSIPKPFTPIELQRDVARLRRFYQTSGFIDTKITYDVKLLNDDNEVDIDVIINEGRAIKLDSLTVLFADGSDPAAALPEDLRPNWARFIARGDSAIGNRYTDAEGARVSGRILDWWMRRGWAFAKVSTKTHIDSAAASLKLDVVLDIGPRATVDSIEVSGNRSVSRPLVLRTIPLKPGDYFSSTKLADGQRSLFALGLFRMAIVEVPKEQPRDSTARIRVRLQESPPRSVTGELGYVSAGGGLTARGEFAHRNFTGGARTLRINSVAQTGLLSIGDQPEREYQLGASYREPLLFRRSLSLAFSPFAKYRDNLTDRSREAGIETTLIYELGTYRFVTLQHRYSTRRVYDYRIGSGSSIDLQTLLALAATGALDSIGPRIQRSTFGLSGSFGRSDPTRNLRSVQFRPSFEVTAPGAINTIQYALTEIPVTANYPLSRRTAISARVRIGRLFPYGKTIEGDSIGALASIQLRDVLLNAGGAGSVRGWGNSMLGPKQLNLQFESLANGDSVRVTGVDGYIPAGGLARATASVEMRLPFPGLTSLWGTHIFFDAGRVWSPDKRFRGEDPNGEERWFYGAGAGVDYNSLVGPIRISIGYKLNPSPLDLRAADKVYDALSQGLDLSSVPTDWKKRFHIHVSLGQSF